MIFFDTETTGFMKKHLPKGHENQPHMVQLAALVCDNEGNTKGSCNLIIKPEGWTIPDDVAAIHGITNDIANRYGIPIRVALPLFTNLAKLTTKAVAHNIQFDIDIIDNELARFDQPSVFGGFNKVCTMESTKAICALPPSPRMVACGMTGFKSPKLIEAYEKLFGKPFENQHDAMADVTACKEIYFEIIKKDAS